MTGPNGNSTPDQALADGLEVDLPLDVASSKSAVKSYSVTLNGNNTSVNNSFAILKC